MMETHRFRNDTQTRKRLMVPESFQHPAKGQLGMWALMIERYSQPGDLVLDPMAGSGSTLLAALMGRNVICVELEQHFVEPMRRSWEKMRTMPMLGCEMGQAVILRGDARCLPLPDASVGAAITSPPYEGQLSEGHDGIDWTQMARDGDISRQPHLGKTTRYRGYTRPVDAIVTSPPYAEQNIRNVGKEPYGSQRYGGMARQIKNTNRYTREDKMSVQKEGHCECGCSHPNSFEACNHFVRGYNQRCAYCDHGAECHPIPPRAVDAIVTSPPYERQDTSAHPGVLEPMLHTMGKANRNGTGHDTSENIGNLRNAAYWDAMRLTYAECWRVLRPGGLLALVLKGFTRDGQYVDLPGQTEALLLEAGWQKHDHWRRELYSLSFWRILQRRRSSEAFDNRLWFEEILAFRKPNTPTTGSVEHIVGEAERRIVYQSPVRDSQVALRKECPHG